MIRVQRTAVLFATPVHPRSALNANPAPKSLDGKRLSP